MSSTIFLIEDNCPVLFFKNRKWCPEFFKSRKIIVQQLFLMEKNLSSNFFNGKKFVLQFFFIREKFFFFFLTDKFCCKDFWFYLFSKRALVFRNFTTFIILLNRANNVNRSVIILYKLYIERNFLYKKKQWNCLICSQKEKGFFLYSL